MNTKKIVLAFSLAMFIIAMWQIMNAYSVLATTTEEEVNATTTVFSRCESIYGGTWNGEDCEITDELMKTQWEADYQAWKQEREESNAAIMRGYCELAGCDYREAMAEYCISSGQCDPERWR